ncbi:MAG: DUF1553 domain-containing protein [Planctomyces sp.]|nr:DUF1553 domain-containing protein [Planctomyces sp.]
MKSLLSSSTVKYLILSSTNTALCVSSLCVFSVLTASAVSLAHGQDEVPESRLSFQKDIRPLLSDRCMSCHGPDAEHRQADLQINSLSDLTRDRDGYRILSSGKPEESRLVDRILSSDPDARMPPSHSGKELSEEEQQRIVRWIREGAEWSEHWAWVRPIKAIPPSVRDSSWGKNWIDRWVLKTLEDKGLQPSRDAVRSTLIRRLHFDLTGLPPKIRDMLHAESTWDDAAYEQLADRLLRSDAYAERMTTWWLDLVRYGDTVGYHGDQDHHISPYRDWVIDAFATNMPFDQFTREQLAGDLLPNATLDQKIATGYNRMLQTTHEGGLQAKEYLTIYAADRVRNLSAVWLGGTLGCAQCHDHKFDPYTAKDFYSMAAFFADIDEEKHFTLGSNELPTRRPPELRVHSQRERIELERLSEELKQVESQLAEAANDESLSRRKKELVFAIDDLKAAARWTMVTESLPVPRTTRILPRGNWMDDSGDVVLPAVPEFLGSLPANGSRATRLDLANWLTDSDEGIGLLTARVFVNRLWALVFGAGLSASVDDFGGQGQPPNHPELLDQLAIEFVDSDWDVRHMLKLMIMSRTYRQTSATTEKLLHEDPANELLGRQSRFRLPAEMIRDNALAVSGLLVEKVGGPSIRPYQPDGYYRHLNFPERTYVHNADDRQWRRGVYIHWQRQFLHPMLKAFDAPMREDCTAQRPGSNTPVAALVLLNDPTFVEAARAFAYRTLTTTVTLTDSGRPLDDQRLINMFADATTRDPEDSELELLRVLLSDSRADFATSPERAVELLKVGQYQVDFPDPIEFAAWTTIARALLNLDEVVTRL